MRLVVTPTIRQLMEDAGHPCRDDSTVSWSDLKAAYARSDYAARQLSLRSVCRGSSIAFEGDTRVPRSSSTMPVTSVAAMSNDSETKAKKNAPTKSQELRSHLQQLQNRLDQRLYDRMVRDVTAQERCADAAREVSFFNYKEQMRYGAHVISMMVVFFLIGYFAAARVVASDALRVLCGVVGMFAAMVMETALFIFRDARDTGRDASAETLQFRAPADANQANQAVPVSKDDHAGEAIGKLDTSAGKVKIT